MAGYDPSRSPSWYRWAVVGVLGLSYAFAIMDRSLMNILQVPLKRDLRLSDGQLGVLTGLAFAVFYATLAIPIARIADRANRMAVLCVCLLLWSVMTAGCGLAGSFSMLLLLRMGVGVGEAGGYPPAASAISDYFGSDRRATALALFGLGAPVGQTLGLFGGGWLNDTLGWRGAFELIGGVGVFVAPLVYFGVREPRRGAADHAEGGAFDLRPAGLLDAARVLWRLKTIRFLFLANMCHGFVLYAYNAWSPPFYNRLFHMPLKSVAMWLSLLSVAGALGVYAGGFAADQLGRRDGRWRIWVLAASGLLQIPFSIAQFLTSDVHLSLALAIVPSFTLLFFVGPTIAAGQSLVQPQMRAMTAAIMLMLYNIFGLGLGPLLVGMLSDTLTKGVGLGPAGLSYAIVAALLVEVVAVAFYFASGFSFPRDMARERSADFPTTGLQPAFVQP